MERGVGFGGGRGEVLLRCLRVRLEPPEVAKVFGFGAWFLSRGLVLWGGFTV